MDYAGHLFSQLDCHQRRAATLLHPLSPSNGRGALSRWDVFLSQIGDPQPDLTLPDLPGNDPLEGPGDVDQSTQPSGPGLVQVLGVLGPPLGQVAGWDGVG